MPDLDLDWELGVFKALRALWRRVAPEAALPYDTDRVVFLTDMEGRLRVVASAVAARAVRILPARGVGGVRGDDLLLPPHIDLAADPEANAGLYVLRAALGALVIRENPAVPLSPLPRFVAEMVTAVAALQALEQQLPAAALCLKEVLPALQAQRPTDLRGRAAAQEAWLNGVLSGAPPADPSAEMARLETIPEAGPPCPPCWLWGRLVPVQLDGVATSAVEEDDRSGSGGVQTAVEAPPTEDIQLVVQNPDRVTELPMHSFEKVETVEAFAGSMRQLDGSDELEEHLEALSEVDLSHLMRGGPPVQSQYSADLRLGVDLPDVSRVNAGEQGIPYNEWDGRKHRYLQDWCQVFPSPLGPGDPRWAQEPRMRHRRMIDRLTQQLLASRARLRPVRRQRDGDDVDIDALVDAQATLASGHDPGGRLYTRRQRPEPDMAVTVLLDVSLSADAWVAGHRVLDLTREATLVLGEVADRVGQPLQVLAFASHTRNRVRVWGVRDWHEPWSVGRARLGGLRPQGYTRIGPALRHATKGLAAVSARRRLLLLITDGKPNDFDRYEGRHGVADVRRAVREAHDQGVHTHALAVDRLARDYLPQMLGPGGWTIVNTPEGLAEALSSIYLKLAARAA